MGQIADAPFTPWLEGVVKELFDIQPTAIAMQMRDKGGKCYTCYWDVSADDRAVMIDAMKDDDRMEWLRCNRELILEILNGEEDGDGLCEDDTESDCTG